MAMRFGCWIACLLITAVLCSTDSYAAEDQNGLNDPANWYTAPLYLRQEDRLPADITPMAGIAAAYSYAYDATVLGVNFKVNNAVEYYGAMCLVDVNGNLDVLDVLGPYSAAVKWNAGPYHLAAGTVERSVHCWLTAPREYPHEVVLTYDYEPASAFSVVVYPAEAAAPDWPDWLATIAFQSHFNSVIRVSHVGGNGRNRGGLDSLPMTGRTEALELDFWPTDDGLLPYLMVGGKWTRGGSAALDTQYGVSVYHYDLLTEGWVRDGRLQQQAFPNGLSLGASSLVAYQSRFGAADEQGQAYVELVHHLDSGPRKLRTGTRTRLQMTPDPELMAFLATELSELPFVLISNQLDISFGRLVVQPGLPYPLAYQELVSRSGDAAYKDGELYARYPVLDLAATARWDTGHPEIYWVQDGSVDQAGGQLFRLRYAPGR